MKFGRSVVFVVTAGALMSGGCRAPMLASPSIGNWMPAKDASPETSRDLPARVSKTMPIELATILRLAGERALEIELAKATAAAAAAEHDIAASKWLPTLTPRLTLVRHEGRLQNTQGALLDVDKHNVFGGAGVSLQFSVADAWFSSIVAEQRAYAARLGIRAAQHVNVGVAVRLYYDLLEATASLQVAQRAVTQARELVTVQETSEKAGRALMADVLQARAYLASAIGGQASVEAEVVEKTARLVGLLVLRADTILVPAETEVAPIEFHEANLPMVILLEQAMASRPEVAQAHSLVAAAESEVDRLNWSWLVPELHIGAAYGSFGADYSRTHGREDYFADLQWHLAFGDFAKSRHADAMFREEQSRLQIVVQNIRTDIRIAVARVRSAKARVVAARDEIAAASAALELEKLRHEAGKSLFLVVLFAERVQTEARIKLIRAICAQNRAQFELHRLVGVN